MDDRETNILGSLSCWGILAAAATLAIGAVAISLAGALKLRDSMSTHLVAADNVCRAGGPAQVNCYVESNIPAQCANGLLMGGPAAGPSQFLVWEQTGFKLFLPALPEGNQPIFIYGSPFAQAMFQCVPVTVCSLSNRPDICLIDAQLASESMSSLPDMRQCIDLLARRGRVAFIHPGPAKAFEHARDVLKEHNLAYPCLMGEQEKDHFYYVLRYAAEQMDYWKPRGPITVITAENDLARTAAAWGFRTCYVGRETIRPQENLSINASWVDLYRRLSGHP